MSFAVSADAYDRFMGRYSVRLGPQQAEFEEWWAPCHMLLPSAPFELVARAWAARGLA